LNRLTNTTLFSFRFLINNNFAVNKYFLICSRLIGLIESIVREKKKVSKDVEKNIELLTNYQQVYSYHQFFTLLTIEKGFDVTKKCIKEFLLVLCCFFKKKYLQFFNMSVRVCVCVFVWCVKYVSIIVLKKSVI
jgi:hypothetical protein